MDKQETDNNPKIITQLRHHAKAYRVKEYYGAKDCRRYIILEDALAIVEATNDSTADLIEGIFEELENMAHGMNICEEITDSKNKAIEILSRA